MMETACKPFCDALPATPAALERARETLILQGFCLADGIWRSRLGTTAKIESYMYPFDPPERCCAVISYVAA
jgi:hypothetical protein